MSKEITKQQNCVLIRGGIELWIDTERVIELEKALQDSTKRFLKINGQLINSFEIIGLFTPESIAERHRLQTGEWKCQKGRWHEKKHRCDCSKPKPKNRVKLNKDGTPIMKDGVVVTETI